MPTSTIHRYLCRMTNVDYKEITIICNPSKFDILIALLGHEGYEGFVEEDTQLKVYIPEMLFDQKIVEEILNQLEIPIDSFRMLTISPQNWNAEWEAAFQPISIGTDIYIRAPFHPAQVNTRFDIVIQPKMSFGTGHHDTTALMMEAMLPIDFTDKTVFDYGCGTGILAVLAAKMNAKSVFAIDVDDWAFENVAENITLNESEGIEYMQGTINLCKGKKFDIILANINRNVLIDTMKDIAELLNHNGILLMSGFYASDINSISEAAEKNSLIPLSKHSSDKSWTVMSYTKNP